MKFALRKKRSTIIGSIIIVLTVFLLFANTLINIFIENKIKELGTQLAPLHYTLSVKKVHTHLLLGNIQFSELSLSPDSVALANLASENATHSSLHEIKLANVKLSGTQLINALKNRQIQIDRILLKNLNLTIYKGSLAEEKSVSEKTFRLDSIQLNGISGISISQIVAKKPTVTFIDVQTKDTLLTSTNSKMELRNLVLSQAVANSNYFELNMNDFSVLIHNEQLRLPGGNYILKLEYLELLGKNNSLQIKDLELLPTNTDLKQFARKFSYVTAIYTLQTSSIKIHNFNLTKSINTNSCIIDSLNISGLNLDILTDKNYPFNTGLRPILPNQLLKNLKFPLHISSINIKQSKLIYEEIIPDSKEPMLITLNNLQASITRASSVKDSLMVRKNMSIQLKTDFMNLTQLEASFIFPLYLPTDTFFYTGSLAAAPLPAFNRITLPALGATFIEGELHSIHFKGSANNSVNSGEMTMLYNGLKTEVAKKDFSTKNHLISWAANTALLNSNPNNKGKTRVAHMYSEKTTYKGFGNFMWKTLQDGITNSILPTADKEKTHNEDSNEERKKEKRRNRQRKKSAKEKSKNTVL